MHVSGPIEVATVLCAEVVLAQRDIQIAHREHVGGARELCFVDHGQSGPRSRAQGRCSEWASPRNKPSTLDPIERVLRGVPNANLLALRGLTTWALTREDSP